MGITKSTQPKAMSKKVKEVMTSLDDDASFRAAVKENIVFVEVYSNSWGRCECFKATIQKLYFQYMDVCKFHMCKIDDIKTLAAEGFDCVEPTYLIYMNGKRLKTIQGINGPEIEQSLKDAKESFVA